MMQRILVMLLVLFVAGCAANKEQIEKDNRIAETQVRLGIGYMQKGDLKYALEKLDRALEVAPNFAPAHNAMALLMIRLARYDEADIHYKRAVALQPEDGVVLNNYGAFLCDHNRYPEAYEKFEKAAKQPLYKTPALAYENAGLCAVREGNLDKAEQSFRQALKVDGSLTVSMINLARIGLQKKNYLLGRAFIQRFEALASHSAATLALAIEIERGMGNEAQVASYSEMLRSRFPDSEQATQLK